MKNWFTSLNSALALSFCAVLAFLWSVLLDMGLVYPPFGLNMLQTGLAALIFTALIGLWLWALAAAMRGSRHGLINDSGKCGKQRTSEGKKTTR
ncbi:MAG: hypothetical protein IT331_15065 [Anaerolineae bacterium]|nr:hypothetical protein [Anaerolineae bacterium]